MIVLYTVRVDEGTCGRAGRIPLSFDYEELNEACLKSRCETEEIYANNGGRRFGSVDEIFDALEA